MESIQNFLDQFLTSPSGRSPQAIRKRMEHWVEVYSHPENFTQDHSPHALAAKRKSARQCLRRLAERHPEIASQVLADRQNVVEVAR